MRYLYSVLFEGGPSAISSPISKLQLKESLRPPICSLNSILPLEPPWLTILQMFNHP